MIFKLFFAIALAFCHYPVLAQKNPIIHLTSFERTSSSILVEGVAKQLPAGTKMWVTVKRINGKNVDEKRDTIKAPENVYVDSNGAFSAEIKRYGSLDYYEFPDGKYTLEFYAWFNSTWQSKGVVEAVGIKTKSDNRSNSSDPIALPKSEDLKYGDFFGERARHLSAIRTIEFSGSSSANSKYKTKSIRLDVIDTSSGSVRKIGATDFLYRDVLNKVGRLKSSQAVSLVCVGAGYGFLADDIYYSGGRENKAFSINQSSTLMSLCHQMEDKFQVNR
jgi:hypothetical protein